MKKLLFLLTLVLAGCNCVAALSDKNLKDAERMCNGQDGVAWIKRNVKWLTVECNNGMVFRQYIYEEDR